MRLAGCRIEGYRSLRDNEIALDPVTVLVGDNGVGKTNVVRALELIQAAGKGNVCRQVAEEGGLESVAWAGRAASEVPERAASVRLTARFEALSYTIEIGPPLAQDAALDGEPVVREERLARLITTTSGPGEKVVMHREGASVWLRDTQGKRQLFNQHLLPSETALFAFRDTAHYPELAFLRQLLDEWRIYHRFPITADAPTRRPCLALCAPALSPDASDLAAALATIFKVRGDPEIVRKPLAEAFPGAELDVDANGGRARFRLRLPDMDRPLEAHEVSEGTLQYLCLIAALASYRPPGLIALNEPEAGLRQTLLPPLARLIGAAKAKSQVLVVTHSGDLVDALKAVGIDRVITVTKSNGATALSASDTPGGDGAGPPGSGEVASTARAPTPQARESAATPRAAPAANTAAAAESVTRPVIAPADTAARAAFATPAQSAPQHREETPAARDEAAARVIPLDSRAQATVRLRAEQIDAQRDSVRRLTHARGTLNEIREMLAAVRKDPEAWPALYPQLQDRLGKLREASDVLPPEMNSLTDTLASEIKALAPIG